MAFLSDIIIFTHFIQAIKFICIQLIQILTWNSFNLLCFYDIPIIIFLIFQYFILSFIHCVVNIYIFCCL